MADTSQATIFVGFNIKTAFEVDHILAKLSNNSFKAHDLSTNELAKTHVRHMVGGRCADAADERLIHFDFPERPGALSQFLNQLGQTWNISLFHYRNHGADKGLVLAGIQVPTATQIQFDQFLATLGYDFTEETENPALRLFL